MAYTHSSAPHGFSILSVLAAPFRWLVALGDASVRARALQALSEETDAQLAKRGTTRNDEIKRILGPQVFV